LFRNYFTTVPEDLFKAARVDGAGFWGIYFKIMLPMSLPIFVVAVIMQVTGIWNDFLFGVVYTKPENYPMTVQLNNIVNSVQGVKEYNVNMAATLLTGLVPLIVYFVSGKLFRARHRRRRRERVITMESVSIRDVSLNFGAEAYSRSSISMSGKGEFLVLLGPSGCGKSTLLNCIAGLLDVSDGQIFIRDNNVTWEEPKDRGIGMVFQSYALYPQMTVEGNLSFGLKNARMPRTRSRERIARAAEVCRSNPCSSASRRSSPAVSASASPSAGRWCAMSTCSCSTSRCPISMPSCVPNCVSRSSGCTTG
jgi:ABC-type multidrug transport system fused ATPase/permease subunit